MIPATYCMSINSAVWDSTAKLSYANANCIVVLASVKEYFFIITFQDIAGNILHFLSCLL